MIVYTSPVDRCDLCRADFDIEMFDARLPFGSWANLCGGCFTKQGCRLGRGAGQRYELQPFGDRKAWVKTAG